MPDVAYSRGIRSIAGFVAAAAVRHLGIRRLSLARRLVVLVAAFSLALQCYIAQTHIHSLSRGFDGAVKTATEQPPAPAKTPIDHSPMECPLCQAVMHAGAVVVSATPILNLPLMWVETVRLTFAARSSSDVTAHEWQSRAPPRL
jgi:hypothetical protein